jgi:peptidoglycan/LPS O-acetylase OafA/YrhL
MSDSPFLVHTESHPEPTGPTLGAKGRAFDVRIPELDALRGIAVVMVLLCHLPRDYWFGRTGVDLFFVLSGFLITGIILRNRKNSGFLKVFYIRRALRIFPIYYLCFLGMLLVNSLRNHPHAIDGIWYYLTYTQKVPSYWGGTTPPVKISVGHTWTLAIEEQFYLIWPMVLVCMNVRWVPVLCPLLIILSCSLRAKGLEPYVLFSHTDGLALGGLLAWLEHAYGTRIRNSLNVAYWLCCVGGFTIYYTLWNTRPPELTGKMLVASNAGILVVSLAYFGLIGLIQGQSGSSRLAMLRWIPLISLGTISYGLYLYHWIIYEHLDTYFKFGLTLGDPWWLDGLKLTFTFAAAILSWKFIESPILRLKDWFAY